MKISFEKDWDMIEEMDQRGGSFVKALSLCFIHADPANYAKLSRVFAEYCLQYRAYARMRKGKK